MHLPVQNDIDWCALDNNNEVFNLVKHPEVDTTGEREAGEPRQQQLTQRNMETELSLIHRVKPGSWQMIWKQVYNVDGRR